jgi:hypothetical protein
MDMKISEVGVEREVVTKVTEVVKTYNLILTEEEAELMVLLTGSIDGVSADGENYEKFELDLRSPDSAAYPVRKLKCNPNDLRVKLTDKIWNFLNEATRPANKGKVER